MIGFRSGELCYNKNRSFGLININDISPHRVSAGSDKAPREE